MAATMQLSSYYAPSYNSLPSQHAAGLRQQPMSTINSEEALEKLRQRVEMRFSSLREAFRRMDRDNSGFLSRDEILVALADFNISPKHLNSLVALLDTNRDGLVSFSEFSAALRPQTGAFTTRLPDRFVTNKHVCTPNVKGGQILINDNLKIGGSGECRPDAELLALPRHGSHDATAAELEGYASAMSDVIYAKYSKLRDAFRAIDYNKDGHLSQEELKRAIRLYNLPIPERHADQLFAKLATREGTVDYEIFAKTLKRKDALGN